MYLSLVLGGIASGFLNALIGTGGGILITLILKKLYEKDNAFGAEDVFASTLAAVAIMSAGTVAVYILRGTFDPADAVPYIIPAVFGGAAGALVLGRINSEIFKKLFAMLVIWAGVSMIVR
ncbi:MAG: sulfite exporter TauE/SafE family protein [Clostridia bacterium]|nr:sulfite exporter TauE/SafE family protein [Clostridia bacterium]